jgi:hypothetical protein
LLLFFVKTLVYKPVKVSIANKQKGQSLGLVELEETFSICRVRNLAGCIIYTLGRPRNEKASDLTSSCGFLTCGISTRACWFHFLLNSTDWRVSRIFTRFFSFIFHCFGLVLGQDSRLFRAQNMKKKKKKLYLLLARMSLIFY